MIPALTLTLKNDFAELERVGRALEDFGEDYALPARVIFDVTLALDEVLTNIISYGYDDHDEHDIAIRLSLSTRAPATDRARELLIEVEDDGRPFNPLDVKEPDISAPIEHRAIGGLGLHLVRRLMTGLDYRYQEGANILTMRRAVAD